MGRLVPWKEIGLKMNGLRFLANWRVWTVGFVAVGAAAEPVPVTPKASPEAAALLDFVYSLSGEHTLTGQHNFPNTRDESTLRMARIYGKTPAVFGQDFGFAAPGDKDSVAARPAIVAECERQFSRGAMITLCWHAVPPTANEPVTFMPRHGTNPSNRLASVQGRLTDDQWHDLLTPGTALYDHWCAQVDVIAGYLEQLQAARVPVLWRPYHEMNGNWFWWGGRPGNRGTPALYRQLFDRMVNVHHLTNLVWVWSVDRPGSSAGTFAEYFPGQGYFDIAALDVYRSDFKQAYYDELLRLANGKPITLAEVGPPPAEAVLEQQPKWCWWMSWAGMGRGTTNESVRALLHTPRCWSLSDPEYREASAPVLKASGRRPPPEENLEGKGGRPGELPEILPGSF
jgi:mannan endo-1,4-beta-mannosidase